jgi:hypothetical protein
VNFVYVCVCVLVCMLVSVSVRCVCVHRMFTLRCVSLSEQMRAVSSNQCLDMDSKDPRVSLMIAQQQDNTQESLIATLGMLEVICR